MPKLSPNEELAEFIGQFYDDPVGFVKACFPWGEGALESLKGLLAWQIEILTEIGRQVKERKFDGTQPVSPIRVAIASGHGIAKTTLAALIGCWIISTRPKSKGKVTAQSWTQLEATTWAGLRFWLSQCITGHWFDIDAERIRHKQYPDVWQITAESPKAENSQSFAGLHAADSSPWIMFDEASELPEKIFEVAQGALTDGQPFIFMFGNPTRNSGIFYDVLFGEKSESWTTRIIDSRDVEITNKQLFQEWVDEHGEDSDFVRVRVRGLPPRASTLQFIPSDLVAGAMYHHREPVFLDTDPLVLGFDVSRGGGDNSRGVFRRGNDARSIETIELSAELTRDSTRTIQIMADQFSRDFNGIKLSHMFVDSTGVGGPMVDRLHELGHKRVTGVNFGALAPEPYYANMRAYIWDKMRSWLKLGTIPDKEEIRLDLVGPGYSYDNKSKLLLESKKSMRSRQIKSPDYADALALTFAAHVATTVRKDPYAARDAKIMALRSSGRNLWLA